MIISTFIATRQFQFPTVAFNIRIRNLKTYDKNLNFIIQSLNTYYDCHRLERQLGNDCAQKPRTSEMCAVQFCSIAALIVIFFGFLLLTAIKSQMCLMGFRSGNNIKNSISALKSSVKQTNKNMLGILYTVFC